MSLSNLTGEIVKSLKSIAGDNWIIRGRSGTWEKEEDLEMEQQDGTLKFMQETSPQLILEG